MSTIDINATGRPAESPVSYVINMSKTGRDIDLRFPFVIVEIDIKCELLLSLAALRCAADYDFG